MPQEIELTPAAIARAVGGELVGPEGIRKLSGFSFDTRTLAPGDVFFAIRGARDGNAFVADAVAKGAAAAVVSDRTLVGSVQLAGTPLIVVGDAVEAGQRQLPEIDLAVGGCVYRWNDPATRKVGFEASAHRRARAPRAGGLPPGHAEGRSPHSRGGAFRAGVNGVGVLYRPSVKNG